MNLNTAAIDARMAKLGMNYGELAQAAGVTRQSISALMARGTCHPVTAGKLADVEYIPKCRSERWNQFIDEITCGDKALARFIQKIFGYALTGDTQHECFFILYGATSRNGKGTLCETFLRMVGDYGRTASPESIAQKKFSDSRSPSEDIAKLAGTRFVNMSEPDKKMILSSALVKTLTGNDTISARFLGENSFDFRSQFKMVVGTNHLP